MKKRQRKKNIKKALNHPAVRMMYALGKAILEAQYVQQHKPTKFAEGGIVMLPGFAAKEKDKSCPKT
jgi:hypothetical protein